MTMYFLAGCMAFSTEPITILASRGYFSFFALLNLLGSVLPIHYNWIDGARG